LCFFCFCLYNQHTWVEAMPQLVRSQKMVGLLWVNAAVTAPQHYVRFTSMKQTSIAALIEAWAGYKMTACNTVRGNSTAKPDS